MNSLNILSSRVDKVIGNPPSSSRTDSFGPVRRATRPAEYLDRHFPVNVDEHVFQDEEEEPQAGEHLRRSVSAAEQIQMAPINPWFGVFKWILSSIAASMNWLMACVCVCDDGGGLPDIPLLGLGVCVLRLLRKAWTRSKTIGPSSTLETHLSQTVSLAVQQSSSEDGESSEQSPVPGLKKSALLYDSSQQEISPRRSIRIQLYNEQPLQRPKVSSVKSPTSPSAGLRLTKYPRSPGPPKPLLPRNPSTKTLILDLDETLIHSLAKGGRMTSGHMVEVKLDKQHAILYYVHKRPFCDEFLRKVSRWYDVVVFTASVQEYADPVIDWLEQDRKYFKGRYYRQHCMMRNGAYIKDIAAVEPDLSKVMIIDNSPMSYIFHEDNAIPIEGWINDPTDIDLLHLIPLLQALQYVADVRALLALRMGE